MARINEVKAKLTSIANSIREKSGADGRLTLGEMKAGVDYLPNSADDNTFILVDENGNEIPGVLTMNEVDLTADAKTDIREGVIAVTDDGVVVGEKEIPAYHTYDGYRAISSGRTVMVPHANYDYTKFQGIVCLLNTSVYDSVATIQVAIDDHVYAIGSTVSLSQLIKDSENHRVDFGITNETGRTCFVRYIMYKEIY